LGFISDTAVLTQPITHPRKKVINRHPSLAVTWYEIKTKQGETQQSGLYPNPELFGELEEFGGSGGFSGQIPLETSSSAVVVSSEAIQILGGNNVVFVPDGHGFKPMGVTIGMRTRDRVEILFGLEPGDRYVAKGAFELKAVKLTSGVDAHAGHGH